MDKAKEIDQKIDENIQKREMAKLKDAYFKELKGHFEKRKYKEFLNMECSNRCLTTFREDDLTRGESKCLVACYYKMFQFLGFSNALFAMAMRDDEAEEGEGKLMD